MATEVKPPQANVAKRGKENLCQNKKVELSLRDAESYGVCMGHMHARRSRMSAGTYHILIEAPRRAWDEQGHGRLEGVCRSARVWEVSSSTWQWSNKAAEV